MAEQRGLYRFRTEQPPYSLLARGIEAEVLPACQRYGMGVLTWSPLAAGFLSGPVPPGPGHRHVGRAGRAPGPTGSTRPAPRTRPSWPPSSSSPPWPTSLGCTLPELALAFTVAHPAVTSVIIGPRTMEQLDGALKGASLALDDAILDRIDEIVPPGTDLYEPTPPGRRRR